MPKTDLSEWFSTLPRLLGDHLLLQILVGEAVLHTSDAPEGACPRNSGIPASGRSHALRAQVRYGSLWLSPRLCDPWRRHV